MHGLIAVSAVPAGIDNVCVWEVFAQDGAVAAQAVDNSGVVLRSQHGDDIFAPAILHGECRKMSALFVVRVDRREHIAIGVALELAAQHGGYAQLAQHLEQLAAFVGRDVDHGVERAALKVLACAVALMRRRRLQDNGQIGRLRQFLGNAAQKLAIGGVAEEFTQRLAHEHGDDFRAPDSERSATSVGDKIDFLGRRADALFGFLANAGRIVEGARCRGARHAGSCGNLGKRRCGANWLCHGVSWKMRSMLSLIRASADTAYYSVPEQRS